MNLAIHFHQILMLTCAIAKAPITIPEVGVIRLIQPEAVCPSWVDTEMLIKERNGKKVKFPGIVTAEAVAKQAMKDAKKGKDRSICSFYVKCQHVNVKLMPQKLTMKLWMHGLKKYL